MQTAQKKHPAAPLSSHAYLRASRRFHTLATEIATHSADARLGASERLTRAIVELRFATYRLLERHKETLPSDQAAPAGRQ